MKSLVDLRNSLTAAFPESTVRWDGTCATTSPASYCGDGSVSVDLEALVRVGRIGDFAAFGAVASRYAVAVQESLGLPVDGVVAGDAKGVAIPSGFARVEAFRDGFLTGSAQSCTTRYR